MKNTTVAPKEELKVLNKAENQTSKSLRSRKVVDISFRDIKYNVLPQKKGRKFLNLRGTHQNCS